MCVDARSECVSASHAYIMAVNNTPCLPAYVNNTACCSLFQIDVLFRDLSLAALALALWPAPTPQQPDILVG